MSSEKSRMELLSQRAGAKTDEQKALIDKYADLKMQIDLITCGYAPTMTAFPGSQEEVERAYRTLHNMVSSKMDELKIKLNKTFPHLSW